MGNEEIRRRRELKAREEAHDRAKLKEKEGKVNI